MHLSASSMEDESDGAERLSKVLGFLRKRGFQVAEKALLAELSLRNTTVDVSALSDPAPDSSLRNSAEALR